MTLWEALTYPFRRQTPGTLSARRPAREHREVPLGMEAIDLSQVDAANRRNDALERSTTLFSQGNPSLTHRAATRVEPMPEDETYAAAYHRAFNKKDT